MIMKSKNFKKRILLVDDDQSVTKMLSMLLETRGYEVKVADCGTEALERVTSSFDLILLDLGLPDQEGLEVCQKLREKNISRHIPIIILSGRMLSKSIIESLYVGADDYLTKPFEYEELVARMEAVMRRGTSMGEHHSSKEDIDIFKELKIIINKEKVTSYFQPIYSLSDFKIIGFEALIRPESDTILSNPEVLFKSAIRFGCYQELEMLSWRTALNNVSKYLENRKLFLNCNPYLVEGSSFLEIKNMFEKSTVDQSNVILEITERSAISNFETFYEQLCRYRDCGFQFAVDDVGGGYASLESIVETKPEVVKIDRHIITNISKDAYKRSIVKFIVAFCKENSIVSVAEGIETKEDLETIVDLGVMAGQGYYLCEPSPTINIAEMENNVKTV